MLANCYRLCKRIFALFTIAIFIIGIVIGIGYIYVNKEGPLSTEKILIIAPGSSISHITKQLYSEGVIKYPLIFQLTARVVGHFHKLKAGEYAFNAAITPKQILEKIINGKYVVHSITFPEGITAKRVIEILNEEPLLFGKIVDNIKEGSLFPSTYFFHYGEKKQAIINNMQHKMSKLVDELWENRDLNNKLLIKNKEDMVILASIIEKETSLKSEQRRIAAVFINRLNQGIKLQADPTIIYIITDKKGYLGRALTRDDLKIISEFNTYINYGLPPTAISNPGKDALEAVLAPLDSKELFFVLDPLTNGHKFTESLLEHNRNVSHYRNQLKQKKKNETLN
ncbi:aminodeoxychorismate lyase [Rickettsiales bacterium Ac37b]|nr:aminodeoxychorismate lyase [Rickettsiales bacterium Ac37b]